MSNTPKNLSQKSIYALKWSDWESANQNENSNDWQCSVQFANIKYNKNKFVSCAKTGDRNEFVIGAPQSCTQAWKYLITYSITITNFIP